MVNKKYYKPDISKEWIRKSPFRYSFNDVYEIAYTYRFPVYKSDFKALEGVKVLDKRELFLGKKTISDVVNGNASSWINIFDLIY